MQPLTCARGRSISKIIGSFLGSMNLAISLLVAISVASAIGTVLQQNQPYNDYIIKFGSFWFEVFAALDLYDVYSAMWFLALMVFLLLSTAVCVYRNTPKILQDVRSWRENVQYEALRSFPHSDMWRSHTVPATAAQQVTQLLAERGYRPRQRVKPAGDAHAGHLIIAKRGAMKRIGYIFTHVAIVVICIGGLLDSRLLLKIAEWGGRVQVELRNIPANEIPPISYLPAWNPSFRASVDIPEGATAGVAFVNLRDGYLVQELPFDVTLKDFRVEHHATGQPKSFESDLVITDERLESPLEATIAVNHPLYYRGYTLYQASFGDGGSKLSTRLWFTDGSRLNPEMIDSAVNDVATISVDEGEKRIEFTDFRPLNINPIEGEDGQIEQRNFGPAMTFRVRNASGQAREYFNYMLPVMQDKQWGLLSGMRESPTESYRYLHLPVDDQGNIARFINLLEKVNDPQVVTRIINDTILQTMQASALVPEGDEEEILQSMTALVQRFLEGGVEVIFEDIAKRSSDADKQKIRDANIQLINTILVNIYRELLAEEGLPEMTEKDLLWFNTAFLAINALAHYGTPFYVQLFDFEQVESSGLQIARAPGKNIVYLGCVLLISGVFMLLYIQYRRFWVWIKPCDTGSEILFVGTSLRRSQDFNHEFQTLSVGLQYYLQQTSQAESGA